MFLGKGKYKYTDLVLAETIPDLVLAYTNCYPVIVKSTPLFTRFDLTIRDKKSKEEIWRELLFNLSLRGLVPFTDQNESLKIRDGNLIDLYCKNNKKYSIFYDNLHQVEKIHKKNENNIEVFEVIDFFDVKSGKVHDFEYIENTLHKKEVNFVKYLRFYRSPYDRMTGENFKDVASFSYLSKFQLKNDSYEENYARLEVLDIMRDSGIRGTKNGINKEGKQLYLTLKVFHNSRVMRPALNYEGEDEDQIRAMLAKKDVEDEFLIKNIKFFGDPLDFIRHR